MQAGKRSIQGAFIPEDNGLSKRQAGNVGADEGFGGRPPGRGQHQHVQRHPFSCPSACIN